MKEIKRLYLRLHQVHRVLNFRWTLLNLNTAFCVFIRKFKKKNTLNVVFYIRSYRHSCAHCWKPYVNITSIEKLNEYMHAEIVSFRLCMPKPTTLQDIDSSPSSV
jgi:hypothetical protein